MSFPRSGVYLAMVLAGRKQRIAIAGAFAGTPEVILAEAPVSALDVSTSCARRDRSSRSRMTTAQAVSVRGLGREFTR